MKLHSFDTDSDRRFWAFIVILGGCFVFTMFAAVGVYLVRHDVKFSFYLALAAHLQLFVGMSTFGFVLGRRVNFKGGKDGFTFDDSASPTTPADGARAATVAAAHVAEKLEGQE